MTNTNFETAPNDTSFWNTLNNGVDFVSSTLDKYLDLKKKEATAKILTQPNGLEFFSTGFGLLSLLVAGVLVVYFIYR